MKCKQIILNLLLLILWNAYFAQSDAPVSSMNQLKIVVIDVAERNPLTDFDLTIRSERDTSTYHIDSTSTLHFDLQSAGKYSATLIKKGYLTLFVDWDNPEDSADLILEFFMPKLKLTNQEKRNAHHFSKHLPEYPCEHCGGFQRIHLGRKEMCTIRFTQLVKGNATGSSFEFRKLKYY